MIITNVTFHFVCDICKDNLPKGFDPPETESFTNLSPGFTVPNPTLPKGWHTVDGMLVCEDHNLSITKYERIGDNKPMRRTMMPWGERS